MENTGSTLLDTDIGKDFLEKSPKTRDVKTKQMNLHQTNKLLYSKGNDEQDKEASNRIKKKIAQYTMIGH